jgi:hypothetical protein
VFCKFQPPYRLIIASQLIAHMHVGMHPYGWGEGGNSTITKLISKPLHINTKVNDGNRMGITGIPWSLPACNMANSH